MFETNTLSEFGDIRLIRSFPYLAQTLVYILAFGHLAGETLRQELRVSVKKA